MQNRSLPRSFPSSYAAANPALRRRTPEDWSQITTSPYSPGQFLNIRNRNESSDLRNLQDSYRGERGKSSLISAGELAARQTPSKTPERGSLFAPYQQQPLLSEEWMRRAASPLPRTLVGLNNLGNTCFMNSVLQCLSHTPRFLEAFLRSQSCDYNRKSKLAGQFAASFASLMRLMRDNRSPVSPDQFKVIIGRFAPQFRSYSQQDAHEFLRFTLDGLHQDLNRAQSNEPYRELQSGHNYEAVAAKWLQYHRNRDDSIVTDFFGGQLLTVTTCGKCGNKSAACDTFLDLSVQIPASSGASLEACLRAFVAPSEISDYKCESCKATSRSAMEMTLWRLPAILVIHLKRFSSSSIHRRKLDTDIRIPIERLDMRPYAVYSTDKSLRLSTYSLFGVVHHTGTLASGHYIS